MDRLVLHLLTMLLLETYPFLMFNQDNADARGVAIL